MAKGYEREDETPESGFERKASELDFDVWGTDSDETSRRRDPLRRRSSGYAASEPDEEELE